MKNDFVSQEIRRVEEARGLDDSRFVTGHIPRRVQLARVTGAYGKKSKLNGEKSDNGDRAIAELRAFYKIASL